MWSATTLNNALRANINYLEVGQGQWRGITYPCKPACSSSLVRAIVEATPEYPDNM